MKSVIFSSLVLGLVAAQKEIEFASFGQRHSLELGYLPDWNLGGTQAPQVLTDKVIFTPPYPGEVSASAWTTQPLNTQAFTINARFLAIGQEHAGGNLQIWYTKEGEAAIHSDTLYTADKFTGLVISIDQRGGPAGGIRGFLNDGTTSFRQHPHLDTLAFGHCDYAYRNRGLPSRLQIKHDTNGLEVLIDDKPCFSTSKISLPSDYFLGLTASSTATPDSFEVPFFITTANPDPPSHNHPHNQQQQQPINANANNQKNQPRSPPSPNANPGQDSSAITHLSETIRRTTTSLSARIEELHSKLARYDQVQDLKTQIANLEHAVQEIKRGTVVGNIGGNGGKGGGNSEGWEKVLGERMGRVEEGLRRGLLAGGSKVDSSRGGSGVGWYLAGMLAIQGVGVGGYIWWKRRGEDGWKGGKYL